MRSLQLAPPLAVMGDGFFGGGTISGTDPRINQEAIRIGRGTRRPGRTGRVLATKGMWPGVIKRGGNPGGAGRGSIPADCPEKPGANVGVLKSRRGNLSGKDTKTRGDTRGKKGGGGTPKGGYITPGDTRARKTRGPTGGKILFHTKGGRIYPGEGDERPRQSGGCGGGHPPSWC